MKHFAIVVSGKVQGVFFRASAKEAAEQLGIKGFAQNLPNGSVLIEAEGATEKLNQFVTWCKTGPPRAQITHVEITEGDLKDYLRFEIKR